MMRVSITYGETINFYTSGGCVRTSSVASGAWLLGVASAHWGAQVPGLFSDLVEQLYDGGSTRVRQVDG